MRINVYAEELTTEAGMVVKQVTDEEFGDRYFYGIRLFLDSPPSLHHSADDDDRSAITVFVPWTRTYGHNFSKVEAALRAMLVKLQSAEEEEQRRGSAGIDRTRWK